MLLQRVPVTKQNQPAISTAELSESRESAKKSTQFYSHPSFSLFFSPPNWWVLITQSRDLCRSITVFRRILCEAKEISLFCNGEKQGVNQNHRLPS